MQIAKSRLSNPKLGSPTKTDPKTRQTGQKTQQLTVTFFIFIIPSQSSPAARIRKTQLKESQIWDVSRNYEFIPLRISTYKNTRIRIYTRMRKRKQYGKRRRNVEVRREKRKRDILILNPHDKDIPVGYSRPRGHVKFPSIVEEGIGGSHFLFFSFRFALKGKKK